MHRSGRGCPGHISASRPHVRAMNRRTDERDVPPFVHEASLMNAMVRRRRRVRRRSRQLRPTNVGVTRRREAMVDCHEPCQSPPPRTPLPPHGRSLLPPPLRVDLTFGCARRMCRMKRIPKERSKCATARTVCHATARTVCHATYLRSCTKRSDRSCAQQLLVVAIVLSS